MLRPMRIGWCISYLSDGFNDDVYKAKSTKVFLGWYKKTLWGLGCREYKDEDCETTPLYVHICRYGLRPMRIGWCISNPSEGFNDDAYKANSTKVFVGWSKKTWWVLGRKWDHSFICSYNYATAYAHRLVHFIPFRWLQWWCLQGQIHQSVSWVI